MYSIPPTRTNSSTWISRPCSMASVRLPPPSSPGPSPVPSPHAQNISDVYNFEDWNVAFEVESTLYRVHKFFFRRESPVLAVMFENHAVTNKDFISLPGISGREFEALLEFMYLSVFEPNEMTLEQWTKILHLANMWSMTRVKTQAIKALSAIEQLAPVDKIVMAVEEGVAEWFFPAYCELVSRAEPLSVAEARKLISLGERPADQVAGMDIVSLLTQARERVQNSYRSSPVLRDIPGLEMVVEEFFGRPTTVPGDSQAITPKTPLSEALFPDPDY